MQLEDLAVLIPIFLALIGWVYAAGRFSAMQAYLESELAEHVGDLEDVQSKLSDVNTNVITIGLKLETTERDLVSVKQDYKDVLASLNATRSVIDRLIGKLESE